MIVTDPTNRAAGGFPWLYGQTVGIALNSTVNDAYITLKWYDRAVEFYTTFDHVDYQFNILGHEYKYFAFGI